MTQSAVADTLNKCALRAAHRVPVVQWPRTPPFHGGNTGSNPVGDANKIKHLRASLPKNMGSKRFNKDFRVPEPVELLFFPMRSAPHNLSHDAIVGTAFYLGHSLRVHIHGDLEVGVAKSLLNRLHIFTVGLHQGSEAVP